MSAIADHLQETLFRNTRPLSNGRMLVRWGRYFYILEAAELRRMQSWKAVYVSILLGAAFVVIITVMLWLMKVGEVIVIDLFYLSVLINVFVMLVDSWQNWRLKGRRQSDDKYDELAEAWERAG